MKKIVNNTIRVKQTNVELVTSALRELESATIAEIAATTGLSVATCGNILKELCISGEITEGELQESNGGRPARKYMFNANHSLAICIVITSDRDSNTLRCALVNLQAEVIRETVNVYKSITFETIDYTIQNLIKKYKHIKAIGIGIPGITREGIITHCDVEELNGLSLKSKLYEKYNLEVTVENEMHAMVYGYQKNHPELEGKSISVLLAPKDHCLGAGFFINGQVIKGNAKMAGEIRFLPLGLSQDEMLKKLNNDKTFMPIIIEAISSILSIVNPAYLILTGSLFQPYMVDTIVNEIREIMPEEFLPQIIFQQDLDADYLKGIISITLETLSSNILLVQKYDLE
jgi:hypothetical protein